MTMAQGDYLPGTYSRVGTEENRYVSWRCGWWYFTDNAPESEEGMGVGQRQMEHAQLLDFRREVQYSGSMGTCQGNLGQFRQMDERRSLENGSDHFSTDNIWRDNFVWYNDLKFKF